MGTKYSSKSISGYNSTPPSDDGAVSESNKVKWSTIKNKLTDPAKVLAEAVNTAINTALDYGPISVVSAAVTLGASHNNQFIELSGASTPTLDDASTLGAGWFVDLKNAGTSTITIARTTSTDTIDTVTADATITPLGYIRYVVNAAASGFSTGGIAQASTQAQTDAGTVSNSYVSPEKLKQWVVNTLASTQTDTDAGLRSDVCVTPETLENKPRDAGETFQLAAGTASNDATLDLAFVSDAPSVDNLIIICQNIAPATDGGQLLMRVGTGATPTYDSGTNYNLSSSAQVSIAPGAGTGNAANEVLSATISIYGINDSTRKLMWVTAATVLPTGAMGSSDVYSDYSPTTAITGIQFLMSTGNINSGKFIVLGVKN